MIDLLKMLESEEEISQKSLLQIAKLYEEIKYYQQAENIVKIIRTIGVNTPYIKFEILHPLLQLQTGNLKEVVEIIKEFSSDLRLYNFIISKYIENRENLLKYMGILEKQQYSKKLSAEILYLCDKEKISLHESKVKLFGERTVKWHTSL